MWRGLLSDAPHWQTERHRQCTGSAANAHVPVDWDLVNLEDLEDLEDLASFSET
jgi:hypothetical protein